MGYWKDKVVPNIKKVFDKNSTKKAAAAEAIKIFDESKEKYTTEFEEKKTQLQPKVVEIYEASSIKDLVKEPKDIGIKKQSAAVQKFLDELAKIEFPGAKAVSESTTKFGAAYFTGPIVFVFEKVSTFIVTEEIPKPEATTTATTEVKEKDIVVEEDKTEEPPVKVVEEAAPPPVTAEPPKA